VHGVNSRLVIIIHFQNDFYSGGIVHRVRERVQSPYEQGNPLASGQENGYEWPFATGKQREILADGHLLILKRTT
jgi:hypothetical protein